MVLKEVYQWKDIWNISVARFILEIFYVWMVVYTPIYLNQYIHLPWSHIGILFTIMLLPFALFEYPIGKLADKLCGEKEIITIGFIIMSLATVSISFITTQSFVLWAVVLFLTRTGASLVEITTESYFFKHVNSKDVQDIAMFRSSRPISYIMAPAIAGTLLFFIPHNYLYLILGIGVMFGIKYTLALRDTK